MSFRSWFAMVTVAVTAVAACVAEEPTATESESLGSTDNLSDPPPAEGGGGSDGDGGSGAGEPAGLDQGEPVIDPDMLTPCPSYVCDQGAHCVPKGLVPPEVQAYLPDCNADMACVPDPFIETNGNFLLESCTAVLGLEGRCLSGCIPMVAESASYLEQGTCAAGELCVPCFDPIDGQDTTVCHFTCDPGPSQPAPDPFPACCPAGNGTCVPKDMVPPESVGSLAQDSCPDASLACVPNEMLDPTFSAEPCIPDIILQMLGIDDGGCLPDCVDAVKNIGQGSCPAGYRCAPCDVFGEPTGACNDDW